MTFDYKFLEVNKFFRLNFTHKNQATVFFTIYFSADFVVHGILYIGLLLYGANMENT
jgi:hypothetical protein